jgi:hypothetical protein
MQPDIGKIMPSFILHIHWGKGNIRTTRGCVLFFRKLSLIAGISLKIDRYNRPVLFKSRPS